MPQTRDDVTGRNEPPPESERERFPVSYLRMFRRWREFWRIAPSWVRSNPAMSEANGMVAPANYERLLGSLHLPDRLPPLTRFERIAPAEANAIARMVRRAASTVIENYCDAKRTDAGAGAMRDQHAKPHGCLRAAFIVRADLPRNLALGVFQPGERYDAIIRFSNAQGTRKSDRFPDGRGMAIKLLNVPGRSILASGASDEARASNQQDFLLTNYPVFFGKNVSDYTQFLELIALPRETWRAKLGWAVKLAIFFAQRPRQLWIFVRTGLQFVDSPLRATYHSMTPYLLGEDRVVRYVAVPLETPEAEPTAAWPAPGGNFLRRALIAELRPRVQPRVDKASFDFAVQIRDNATPDDVEDASRVWSGPNDAWIPLGRIEIPLQDFDNPEQWYRGENLSFNPWRCLPEHRPLGGLNRMRLAVYRASLEIRHRLNMAP
jgi:hypothetical protein